MDKLEITALRTKTRIGVHAWEQRILQELVLDLHIPFDCTKCDDRLENTIDYDALCQQVCTFVESNTFALIETVAESIANLVKRSFPMITTLIVRVSKPHAIANAGNISITINR